MTDIPKPVRAFYVNATMREMIPIYPLYAIMFGEHGTGPLALSILFSIWAATGILLEVPSGAMADRFSRKWLIVASGLFKAGAFFTWWAWQDFQGYAIGFMLWGTGSALRSGAFEAMLYDILADRGEPGRFAAHYGRLKALGTIAVVAGEITGGLLIVHGYDIVLLVSMLMPLLASAAFAIMAHDPPREQPSREQPNREPGYLDHLRGGVAEVASSGAIRYIFLVFTLLIVAGGILDEYVNPVIFEAGFSLATVAFLSAGVALAEAAGQASADLFRNLGRERLLAVMSLAAMTLLACMPLGGLFVPVSLALFFAIFGTAGTLFAARLQDEIDGSSRATVTSVVGLGESMGAILWFMVFGAMAEDRGMTVATMGFSILTIGLCLLFAGLGRHVLRHTPV